MNKNQPQVTPDDVFIPGGLPDSTYVPRDHLNLPAKLSAWKARKQKPLLSVSGPTKSGKTVLLKKTIPEAIWLSGGAIDTAEDFWKTLADELEVFTDHQLSVSTQSVHASQIEGMVSAGVFSAGGTASDSSENTRQYSRSRNSSPRSAARKLLKESKQTLVIDDFHYIPAEEQLVIVRGLKDLIFDGLAVVVAAVPHRAYDVVRVEKEMTGRVEPLEVTLWGDDDLLDIAAQGFKALDVRFDLKVANKLAAESFGSPHLMQTHCLNICYRNTDEGSALQHEFGEPIWQEFFAEQASATSKAAFDLLKRGPRQRTDRIIRKLKSGVRTDIYGAVLAAIEDTGPKTQLTYEEVRASLRSVLSSDVPQRHEITNVLDQMTTIARKHIGGEPVLEYDAELSTLYLADPFFAYYLRWASPNLKDLAVASEISVSLQEEVAPAPPTSSASL